MNNLFGMPVISHPCLPSSRPKMQLPADLMVSDEFRAKHNAWLEEFFGRENVMFIVSGKLMASPENVAMLRNFK